ncbi:hypothetical protein A2774_04030 [Candidatus Roizmanbacteria bacterium RIFCSPHIGHO2_01_FULL_39_12c]|uniref:Rod shape-determining protein RodA n=1 Tax=Candidatus Roizmanbacteria bacterium RIFCSPHIGHO2_01_FULL_39_12c TaxID=1802031 RepID=A0A1F7GEG2_9BACT|nr:MAG: hypothetical protein A2774_04030 [Candidatus Roizmanbacteria bacterium RIFCSPHIGHO2_01_FULL_39_12c]OGK48066.1 MAG: hypothetical protein A2963_03845 [Candidatus Roizmanbacteria bacterium RIFCSPLOWO2_01_FULL_40_13]
MTKIILPVFFLNLLGFFNLFGIDQALAVKQFYFIVACFAAFFLVKKIGRNFITANSVFFYWLSIGFLILTFFIGKEIRGSKRWIDFYFFNFQASEIFKPFFILFLANYLIRDYRLELSLKTFLKSLGFFLLPFLLVFKQPDLGNAGVYLFVFLILIMFSGLPKKYLFYISLALLIIFPVFWNLMKVYQRDRILSFFNPKLDQRGTAYNMTQAIITVGSGKLLGRGLGLGTQSRLYFLPENHTDFAYSSLVEQFGFLGGLVVIGLYIFVVYLLIRRLLYFYYSREADMKKKFLYSIGFMSYFIFQIFVNIGMNVGLFPITGIALPFISFGGSSLVATMVSMALLP